MGFLAILGIYILAMTIITVLAFRDDDELGMISLAVSIGIPIIGGYLYLLYLGIFNLWLWIANSTPPNLWAFFTILLLVGNIFAGRRVIVKNDQSTS